MFYMLVPAHARTCTYLPAGMRTTTHPHTLMTHAPLALPPQNELKDTLSVQEGHIFDYADIVDDRRRLES